MLSARLIHPSPNTIILVFFDLCKELLTSKPLSDLQALRASLDKYKPTQNNIDHRSDDQKTLLDCENVLFHVLELVADYQQHIQENDSDHTELNNRVLKLRAQMASVQTAYPLVQALMMYARLVVDVVLMPDGLQILTARTREQAIKTALRFISDVYKFKSCFYHCIFPATDNISDEFLNSINSAVDVILADLPPKNKFHDCSLELVNIMLAKLFRVREQLEISEKAAAAACRAIDRKKSYELLLHQRACDHVAQIDASIRRLNLSNHAAIRRRYDQQVKQYHKFNRTLDVLFWSGNVEVNNMFVTLKQATAALFVRLQGAESVLSTMMLLKGARKPYNQKMDDTMLHQANIVYMKSKLLLMHARSLVVMKAPVESADQFMARSAQHSKLISDLEKISRLTYTLIASYEIGNQDQRIYSESLLDAEEDTLQFSLDTLNFSSIKTELFGFMLAIQFQLKIRMKLAAATRTGERQEIFDEFLKSILKNMERLNEEMPTEFSGYAFSCKQLLLDCYYYLMLMAKDDIEACAITAPMTKKLVFEFTKDMPNVHEYRFLDILVTEVLRAPIEIAKIDINTFSRFKSDVIQFLISCTLEEIYVNIDTLTTISAPLKVVLLKSMATLLLYAIKTSPPDATSTLKDYLMKLNEYYTVHMKFINDTYTVLLPDDLIHEPFRLMVDKQSFLPPAPPVISAKKQSPEKKETGDTRSNSNQRKQPELSAPFDIVYTYFNHDIVRIQRFYTAGADGHDTSMRGHAILGLASCIPYLANDEKRQAYTKSLKRYESSLNEENKAIYDEMTRPYQPAPQTKPAVTPNNTPAGTPAPSPQKEGVFSPQRTPDTKKKRSLLTRRSLFSTPQAIDRPVVAYQPAPLIHYAPELKTPLIEMHSEIEPACNIEFTVYQDAVIQLLHQSNMFPVMQGGGPMEALLGIPRRDTDLLCFPRSEDQLRLLLKNNMEKLNISTIRRNDKRVMVIKFKIAAGQPAPIERKLEIAFLVAKNMEDIDHILRECARNYGPTLIYYDPIVKKILDPLRQASRIKLERIFDVGTPLYIDINKCFQQSRERMLVTAYKQARFNKHGKPVKLSVNMNDAILQNRNILDSDSAHRLSIFLFMKLFLYGHATESFAILNEKPFGCVEMLFPFLLDETGARKRNFFHACQLQDRALLGIINPKIKTKDIDLLCGRFISSFLPAIIAEMNPDLRAGDYLLFSKECGKLLFQTRFSFRKEAVSIIKSTCWGQFLRLHQAPVTASPLFKIGY